MPPPITSSPSGAAGSPILSPFAGDDPRICRADGLRGELGLYQVDVNGEIRYMTKQELDDAKFQPHGADAGTPAGTSPVVRSNNYRELLRESLSDTHHKSYTDGALNRMARDLFQPRNAFEQLLPSAGAGIKADFDARVEMAGRTTVRLDGFKPPGWEAAGGNEAACFKLATAGAAQTACTGDSPTGGGGVLLYEAAARRIKTDADASKVALAQIKAHVDSGRAVVAGVNEPANASVIDAAKQPVTDHFVAVYGYETDKHGAVTALLAKDNAIAGTGDVRFTVNADGSITKPAEQRPKGEDYLEQEYQLSELRFHTSLPYGGNILPTNDAGKRMYW